MFLQMWLFKNGRWISYWRLFWEDRYYKNVYLYFVFIRMSQQCNNTENKQFPWTLNTNADTYIIFCMYYVHEYWQWYAQAVQSQTAHRVSHLDITSLYLSCVLWRRMYVRAQASLTSDSSKNIRVHSACTRIAQSPPHVGCIWHSIYNKAYTCASVCANTHTHIHIAHVHSPVWPAAAAFQMSKGESKRDGRRQWRPQRRWLGGF